MLAECVIVIYSSLAWHSSPSGTYNSGRFGGIFLNWNTSCKGDVRSDYILFLLWYFNAKQLAEYCSY
jgi:hypothetical protein